MLPRSATLEAPATAQFDALATEIDAAFATDLTSDMPTTARPDLGLTWHRNETGQLEGQWSAAEPAPVKQRATHTSYGAKTFEEFMAEYPEASLAEMAKADAAWMTRQLAGQEDKYSFLGQIGSHAEAVAVVDNNTSVTSTLNDMKLSIYRFQGREGQEESPQKQRAKREAALMRKDIHFEAARIAAAEDIPMEEAWKKVDRAALFGGYDLDDIFADLEYADLVTSKPAATQRTIQEPMQRQPERTRVSKKELAKYGDDEMALRFQRFYDGSESSVLEKAGEYMKIGFATTTILGWLAAGYAGTVELLERNKNSEFAAALLQLIS